MSAVHRTDRIGPSWRHRARAAAAGMAVLGLLAACAGEGTEPSAETRPEAPAAGNESAAAGFPRPEGCAADTVLVRVGDATVAVPPAEIEEAVPSGMTPPFQRDTLQSRLAELARTGAGCPDKPLDAALLLIRPAPAHPLLEGRIGFLRVSQMRLTAQFAELTDSLQKQPTQNCRDLGPDLLGCVGTETRGTRETPVMYVITKDRTLRMQTGGPLAARCVLAEGKVQGCNLVDQIGAHTVIDATLAAGNYTSAGLAAAHRAALEKIAALRQ